MASAPVEDMLLQAAHDGNLRLFKKFARALDKGRGRLRETVEAARVEGVGALYLAARNGHLEVCRYLVEELGMDVNAVNDTGRPLLVSTVLSENATVIKYLLDHGADPDKADNDGFSPLHTAAGIGDCEIVELLLAKGAYVDPLSVECGTPLHIAAKERQDGTMKILLDHNADFKRTYNLFGIYGMTPLFQAISYSSVKCVKLLVEAGADINSDCILTALRGSINGDNSMTECLNFLLEAVAKQNVTDDDEHVDERKIAYLKSLGSEAFEKKEYCFASLFYSKAIDLDPDDATLFSNRSLCWLRLGDGEKALQDALKCREMWPDWPKACYRQGASLMLLEVDYESACQTLLDGLKLDPEMAEIEHALCYMHLSMQRLE
ncbi:hypothetical protein EJB05_21633 [Eragrostis curvula]|uniref:Serine/threonine-protein kinase BSK1-like TPR repeats domain-containing protein n=1 Tax=Eragrostis curvula TaxID=38414 RepID=A0A5J9V3U1_9POAL|nr:hypothetical protein EJB05_21633 [Eragrostis curvula]